MNKTQYAINIFVMPFVLVMIGFFAVWWLASDLWKGADRG